MADDRANRQANPAMRPRVPHLTPPAREILDREGITVIDYRPLQQVWNT
jgi:hypothetical protein